MPYYDKDGTLCNYAKWQKNIESAGLDLEHEVIKDGKGTGIFVRKFYGGLEPNPYKAVSRTTTPEKDGYAKYNKVLHVATDASAAAEVAKTEAAVIADGKITAEQMEP